MSPCNCQCDHCRPITIRPARTANSTAMSIQCAVSRLSETIKLQAVAKKKSKLILTASLSLLLFFPLCLSLSSSLRMTITCAFSVLFRRNSAVQLIRSALVPKLKIRSIVYPRRANDWREYHVQSVTFLPLLSSQSVRWTRMDCCDNQFSFKNWYYIYYNCNKIIKSHRVNSRGTK